jgi:23S rRNA (pseudouridine1915-N3)-methyltransferase
MKLHIIAVGHKMPAWIETGCQEYIKRMPREAQIVITEIKPDNRSSRTTEQIMEIERDRILAALPTSCYLVALDERGAAWRTTELAQKLKGWLSSGLDVAFVIGGADGLHPDIKKRANQLLQLSALTLPHAMVRVLLSEQLYRAWSILQNHPYHRE